MNLPATQHRRRREGAAIGRLLGPAHPGSHPLVSDPGARRSAIEGVAHVQETLAGPERDLPTAHHPVTAVAVVGGDEPPAPHIIVWLKRYDTGCVATADPKARPAFCGRGTDDLDAGVIGLAALVGAHGARVVGAHTAVRDAPPPVEAELEGEGLRVGVGRKTRGGQRAGIGDDVGAAVPHSVESGRLEGKGSVAPAHLNAEGFAQHDTDLLRPGGAVDGAVVEQRHIPIGVNQPSQRVGHAREHGLQQGPRVGVHPGAVGKVGKDLRVIRGAALEVHPIRQHLDGHLALEQAKSDTLPLRRIGALEGRGSPEKGADVLDEMVAADVFLEIARQERHLTAERIGEQGKAPVVHVGAVQRQPLHPRHRAYRDRPRVPGVSPVALTHPAVARGPVAHEVEGDVDGQRAEVGERVQHHRIESGSPPECGRMPVGRQRQGPVPIGQRNRDGPAFRNLDPALRREDGARRIGAQPRRRRPLTVRPAGAGEPLDPTAHDARDALGELPPGRVGHRRTQKPEARDRPETGEGKQARFFLHGDGAIGLRDLQEAHDLLEQGASAHVACLEPAHNKGDVHVPGARGRSASSGQPTGDLVQRLVVQTHQQRLTMGIFLVGLRPHDLWKPRLAELAHHFASTLALTKDVVREGEHLLDEATIEEREAVLHAMTGAERRPRLESRREDTVGERGLHAIAQPHGKPHPPSAIPLRGPPGIRQHTRADQDAGKTEPGLTNRVKQPAHDVHDGRRGQLGQQLRPSPLEQEHGLQVVAVARDDLVSSPAAQHDGHSPRGRARQNGRFIGKRVLEGQVDRVLGEVGAHVINREVARNDLETEMRGRRPQPHLFLRRRFARERGGPAAGNRIWTTVGAQQSRRVRRNEARVEPTAHVHAHKTGGSRPIAYRRLDDRRDPRHRVIEREPTNRARCSARPPSSHVDPTVAKPCNVARCDPEHPRIEGCRGMPRPAVAQEHDRERTVDVRLETVSLFEERAQRPQVVGDSNRPIWSATVVERAHPHHVTRGEQPPPSKIGHHEGEVTIQPLDTRASPALV